MPENEQSAPDSQINAESAPTAPQAPAPSVSPPDRPEPQALPGEGEADLAAAFGEPPPSSKDGEAGDETSDQPGEATSPDAASAAQPSPVDPSQSLDAVIQQRVGQEIAAREAQVRAQQANQQLARMSDADYGRYMRQYQAQAAQFQTVQESVASRFYVEATQDVVAKVPELQKLTPTESQSLDPKKFQTYGEMVSKWVDTVAEKRAKGAAERQAKTMFESWKAEEVSRLAKEFPKAPSFGSPSGYGSDEPSFDRASGEELLAFGLSQKSK